MKHDDVRRVMEFLPHRYPFLIIDRVFDFEEGKRLGIVEDIDRIAASNYLNIITDSKLVEAGFAKKFLVPFEEPFKVDVDIDKKIITLSGAMDILEAS